MLNVQKLYEEFEDAGLPVVGCSSDGRVDFDPAITPTQAQRDAAAAIVAAHNPNVKTKRELRVDAVEPGQWDVEIAALEAGRATPGELQSLLLKIAKYLREIDNT